MWPEPFMSHADNVDVHLVTCRLEVAGEAGTGA
jgi:hypothetical protein